jgi:hypothetical protein
MKSCEIEVVGAEIEGLSGFTRSVAVEIVGIRFSGRQTQSQELRLRLRLFGGYQEGKVYPVMVAVAERSDVEKTAETQDCLNWTGTGMALSTRHGRRRKGVIARADDFGRFVYECSWIAD